MHLMWPTIQSENISLLSKHMTFGHHHHHVMLLRMVRLYIEFRKHYLVQDKCLEIISESNPKFAISWPTNQPLLFQNVLRVDQILVNSHLFLIYNKQTNELTSNTFNRNNPFHFDNNVCPTLCVLYDVTSMKFYSKDHGLINLITKGKILFFSIICYKIQ